MQEEERRAVALELERPHLRPAGEVQRVLQERLHTLVNGRGDGILRGL